MCLMMDWGVFDGVIDDDWVVFDDVLFGRHTTSGFEYF